MSFIMDALSRADRERDAQQQVPTLNSGQSQASPTAPSQAGTRRWHLERWLIVAVLTGLLLLEVYDRTRPAEPLARSAPVARVPESALRPSTAQPAIVPVQPRQRAAQEPAGHKTVPAPVSAAGPANRQAIASLYDAPPDESDQAAIPDSKTSSKPATPVAKKDADRLAGAGSSGYGDIPYITELPQALRKQIPTLDYAEHFPSTDPGAGRVRVNGALRAEGQQIAPDLELVAIEEDGIIMRFRDTEFRLPALNRWVNF